MKRQNNLTVAFLLLLMFCLSACDSSTTSDNSYNYPSSESRETFSNNSPLLLDDNPDNTTTNDGANSDDCSVLLPHTNTIIAGKNSITVLSINGDVLECRGTLNESGELAVEEVIVDRNVQTLYLNDMPGNFTYCIAVDNNGLAFNPETGESDSTAIQYLNDIGSVIIGYSATYDHAMLLLDDGSLWAYGENEEGAINGGRVSKYLFEPIEIMDNVESVATAGFHTLAITSDGSLWGWGDDRYGQLAGYGELTPFTRSIKIMENVEYIFASERESFAVTTDNILWGWGDNTANLIDFESSNPCYTPVQIMDCVKKFVADVDYPRRAFIIKTDGSLWAYGTGYLGDGENTNEFKPPVKIMDSVVDVATYNGLTIALKEDGTVWWWGFIGDSFQKVESLSPTRLFDNVMSPK